MMSMPLMIAMLVMMAKVMTMITKPWATIPNMVMIMMAAVNYRR